MDAITIVSYGSLISLGLVLGLLGAGGSILTVPILVYLHAIPASLATGYSLAIVGVASTVAAVAFLRRKQADLRMAAIMGGPMLLSVYFTRLLLFPAVPDPVVSIQGLVLSKDTAVMLLFAAIMLVSAVSTIRRRSSESPQGSTGSRHARMMAVIGLLTGVLTGFAGVGGGFIILPVLVFFGRLQVNVAVGTSLTIIAANALIGFVGESQAVPAVDFGFLFIATILALLGIAIGIKLGSIIAPQRLKAGFGWFVLVMGVFIGLKESFGL